MESGNSNDVTFQLNDLLSRTQIRGWRDVVEKLKDIRKIDEFGEDDRWRSIQLHSLTEIKTIDGCCELNIVKRKEDLERELRVSSLEDPTLLAADEKIKFKKNQYELMEKSDTLVKEFISFLPTILNYDSDTAQKMLKAIDQMLGAFLEISPSIKEVRVPLDFGKPQQNEFLAQSRKPQKIILINDPSPEYLSRVTDAAKRYDEVLNAILPLFENMEKADARADSTVKKGMLGIAVFSVLATLSSIGAVFGGLLLSGVACFKPRLVNEVIDVLKEGVKVLSNEDKRSSQAQIQTRMESENQEKDKLKEKKVEDGLETALSKRKLSSLGSDTGVRGQFSLLNKKKENQSLTTSDENIKVDPLSKLNKHAS